MDSVVCALCNYASFIHQFITGNDLNDTLFMHNEHTSLHRLLATLAVFPVRARSLARVSLWLSVIHVRGLEHLTSPPLHSSF